MLMIYIFVLVGFVVMNVESICIELKDLIIIFSTKEERYQQIERENKRKFKEIKREKF